MAGSVQEALPLEDTVHPVEAAFLRGYDAGAKAERESIDGFLASWFAQQDPGRVDQSTWQDVLRAVDQRAYMRGLNEGRADD